MPLTGSCRGLPSFALVLARYWAAVLPGGKTGRSRAERRPSPAPAQDQSASQSGGAGEGHTLGACSEAKAKARGQGNRRSGEHIGAIGATPGSRSLARRSGREGGTNGHPFDKRACRKHEDDNLGKRKPIGRHSDCIGSPAKSGSRRFLFDEQ